MALPILGLSEDLGTVPSSCTVQLTANIQFYFKVTVMEEAGVQSMAEHLLPMGKGWFNPQPTT